MKKFMCVMLVAVMVMAMSMTVYATTDGIVTYLPTEEEIADAKEELADLLGTAGVVRITGSEMSRMIPGEAHDGSYPLREYSRIVEED